MASPEEEAVLTTIKSFFAALNSKNYAQCHDYIVATGHAALLRPPNPDPIAVTLPELIAQAEKIVAETWPDRTFEETFEDPEVRVDEHLAVVWAKCRLLVDGEAVGSGRNVFCLHRVEGEWRISGVADWLQM